MERLRLKQLAGQWEGDETMYPSQWDPQGGVAHARMASRIALDGFALLMDYEQSRDGRVTYQGHGVMTHDGTSGTYHLHWFDSMGGVPEVFTGGFDGDVLTVAHGGPAMHVRMTYDVTDRDAMKTRMEMSADGSEWKALFDGVYRRS